MYDIELQEDDENFYEELHKTLEGLKGNNNSEVYLKYLIQSLNLLYYDNSLNKTAEIEGLYKEKERLEASISRREKLLANVNYVNKAPKNIVETERQTLEKEKQELEVITKKLK